MFDRVGNGKSLLARGLLLLVVLTVLAIGIPAPIAPVRAATDGSITIHVWVCPPNVTETAGDLNAFASACTTPGSNLTFLLTVKNDDLPRTRKTDYPKPGAGLVKWMPPFLDVVTIRLSDPPPDLLSVVFCDDGSGAKQETLPDGATMKTDYHVTEAGLDCQWFFVTAPQPTATPVPPTSTPSPTATPTATPAPTNTQLPTSTPTPTPTPTLTPTPTATRIKLPEITPTSEPEPTETPFREPTATPTPKFIEKPIKIAALPVLNGANYGYAYAVNDDRIIVGASGLANAEGEPKWQSAVRWTDDGQTLEELPAAPGGIFNEARDINQSGQIVGFAVTADGHSVAVLWDQDEPALLGFLGSGTESQAFAINDRGQVVGVSTTAPGQSLNAEGAHAFLWDPDEGMIDLGTLNGAPKSTALDINDDGLIVGQSDGHAVAWGSDHEIIDFGVAGYAASVNASGWVTGAFASRDAYSHAYLLAPNATASEKVDLKNIRKTYSTISMMNAGNVVVGQSCDQPCPNGDARATLWQNGKIYDLQSLLDDGVAGQWTLHGAEGINRRGDIVGFGDFRENAGDSESTVGFILFAGARRSVLPSTGTPAPTPTSTPESSEPPREIKFAGDCYLQDRIVPVKKTDLVEVTGFQSFVVYAHTTEGPYSALYIPVSKRVGDGMVRYLPEQVNTGGDIICPAEQLSAVLQSPYQSDQVTYVYAGHEPDIGASFMSPISPESKDVFYETGSTVPIKEFYIKVDDQFERWIRIDDSIVGLVDQLAPGLSFAGQPLAYRETLTDAGSLRLERVGCAGPFAVKAEFGQGSQAAKLYIIVGNQTLVFNATAQGSTGADRAFAFAPKLKRTTGSHPGGSMSAPSETSLARLAPGVDPGRQGGAVLREPPIVPTTWHRWRTHFIHPHHSGMTKWREPRRDMATRLMGSPLSGQRVGAGS